MIIVAKRNISLSTCIKIQIIHINKKTLIKIKIIHVNIKTINLLILLTKYRANVIREIFAITFFYIMPHSGKNNNFLPLHCSDAMGVIAR